MALNPSTPSGSTVRPDTPRNRGDNDAPHMTPVTPAEDVRTLMINRVGWGAILAGVALALVTQLILSMIGAGIGLATLDPGTGDNPSASGFSMAAAIWWAVSGIIAAFIGGFAAGRLAGVPKESTAGWHGLGSWAVTTLVIAYLAVTTATTILGGTFSALTSTMTGMAQGVTQGATAAAANGADPFAAIQQTITGGSNGTAAANDPATAAVAAMKALLTGNPADQTAAREQAAQALATARNIPIEEARTQVTQMEQQYNQAKGTVAQTADKAATTASTGTLVSAIALIIGAIAAWFGGRSGAIDPTITARAIPVTRRRE
jgi:hypothetical protein